MTVPLTCYQHAPSFAGGPLRMLNGVLAACAAARADGTRPTLQLINGAQRDWGHFRVLNDHGDPTRLGPPWPEDASPFLTPMSKEARTTLLSTTLAMLPGTPEARAVAETLFPQPGETCAEAANRFWSSAFAEERLVVELIPESSAEPDPGPEVIWLSRRHDEMFRRHQVDPSAVLAGEQALVGSLSPPPPDPVMRAHEQAIASLQHADAALSRELEAFEPTLLGPAGRWSRAAQRGLLDLKRRIERVARNRSGISRAKWHRLYQALRPHDRPQSEGLGLLCFAALFHLDLTQLPTLVPRMASVADSRKVVFLALE